MSEYKVGDIVCLHSLSGYYTDYRFSEYFGNRSLILIVEEEDDEGDYYVKFPTGECDWLEATWIKEKLGEEKTIPKKEKKQSPTIRFIRGSA